jgi:putative acetyltransferase
VDGVRIAIDDPRAEDVQALLAGHLAFAHQHTPAEGVHALALDRLVDPAVTVFSARRDGRLLAMGALRELDETQAELKSMHTAEAARRQGIGRAMVDHLLAVARQRGYQRVSLETGTMDAFTAARALYMSAGFTACGPFGQYELSPTSAFMTLILSYTT